MSFFESDGEVIIDNIPSNGKFQKMMHYIIWKSGSRGIPKTLLAKLCYFSDFDNYELYAESISGEMYRKAKHGPLAIEFKDTYGLLEYTKKIRVEEIVAASGNRMFKCISIADPDLTGFSEREIETIDWVIYRYGKYASRAINEISHNDVPWVSTRPGEIIDYELVFYRNDKTSVLDDDIEDEESGSD